MRRILPTLAVGVLATALVALTVLSVRGVTSGVAQPRVAERVRAVEAAATGVAATFDSLRVQASAVAAPLAPWGSTSPGDIPGRLQTTATATPAFTDRFVVDATGRIEAAATGSASFVNLVRGGAHIERALAGEPAVSDVSLDPLLRVPVLYVAAPIPDTNGTPVRASIGLVRLAGSTLEAQLASIPVPPGGQLALVDPTGNVLRPAGGAQLDRAGPELAAPASLAREGSGSVEFEGIRGVNEVAAYAPVGDSPWSLILVQEAAAFTPFAEGSRAAAAAVPGAGALAVLAVVATVLLRRRARQAEERESAAKRAFLAVSGHELRTPVTVINGMMQTLLTRGDALDPAFVKRALRQMDLHGRRLHLNIERILFVAQLEGGQAFSVATRSIDVAPVLRRAVDHAHHLSPVHEVSLDVPDPGMQVDAEPGALEQVLVQVLDNAIRYSPAEGSITVRCERNGRWARITVEDEGVGLPTDTSRLLEPFTQGEGVDTRVRDEGGVGLGLHIVKTLTEAMGGRVRLERRPVGTRVVIDLAIA